MTHKDLIARAIAVRDAVRAGTRPWDIRKAGEVLDGKYDQDFIMGILDALAQSEAARREALQPFVALARAVTDEGSPDFLEWVRAAADWTVVFSFAGHSITLGQLRALAALTDPGEKTEPQP